MEYNYDNNQEVPPRNSYSPSGNNYEQKKNNGMATASLVLGIISIVSLCCIYLSLILGALGITLGILSKGSDPKLSSFAKVGIGLSIGGICLTLLYTVFFVSLSYITYGTETFTNAFEKYKNYYDGL